MGKWPDPDVFARCCDVYELFNSEKKEDWMLSYEFLNDEKTVVIAEESKPEIVYHRTKRLFFGFNGVNLNEYEISDRKSLAKILFSIYKSDSYFGFQNQAIVCLKLILTKVKQLEACEENDEFSYEVFFCGYSIGGSVAATAFVNLLTRFKFKSDNIPEDSTMMLPSIPGGVNTQIRQNFQEFEIDQKIKLESGHEFYCITHGAAMFGNEKNKEYCVQQRFAAGIFNVVHEKDPVPKLFHHFISTKYKNMLGNNGFDIGSFLLLEYRNGKLCPKRIDNEDFRSIEELFNTTTNLAFDMSHHLLDIYKVPATPGNTELDKVTKMNKDMEDSKKPYVITEYIGKGAYGLVFKAVKKTKSYAIKKIIAKHHNFERDNREFINLLKLTNEHIIEFIEHFDHKKTLYLVFEYCLYGDLESYIMSNENQLEKEGIREFLFQLLLGLCDIHRKNIIHRDIKPANILVTILNNGNTCYKISDFGSSVMYEGHLKPLSAVGTPLYTSPEIYLAVEKHIVKVKLDKKTDIFSLGAVILFCIKKEIPWRKDKFEKLIKSGFEEMIAMEYINEPDELKAMLVLMLQNESYKRFTTASLLLHPFIRRNSTKINEDEFEELISVLLGVSQIKDAMKELASFFTTLLLQFEQINVVEDDGGIKITIENVDLAEHHFISVVSCFEEIVEKIGIIEKFFDIWLVELKKKKILLLSFWMKILEVTLKWM